MNMVSLKTEDSGSDCCRPSYYDNCPCLYLSDDQCEALGFTLANLPKPGTVIEATIRCTVSRVAASANDGDEPAPDNDVTMDLKVTDMAVTDSGKSAAETLYKG